MDWTAILSTKAGGIALLLCLGGSISLFLRLLYGPKGWLRDTHWDEQNDIMTRAEQGNPAWLLPHLQQFQKYSQSFFAGTPEVDTHLILKQEHTLRVLDNAKYLAAHEKALQENTLYRATLLGALYHDIGRFSQFVRYRTFADAASCNHGHLGSIVLAQKDMLRTETKDVRHLAKTAVCLHNKADVPANLPPAYAAVLHAVRDADKLDILRLLAGHLGPGKTPDSTVIMHLQDEPGRYSPCILQALEENRTAAYPHMRFINDFRLLLCTWIGGLHFSSAKEKLRQTGDLTTIIEGLEGLDAIKDKARALVRQRLQ